MMETITPSSSSSSSMSTTRTNHRHFHALLPCAMILSSMMVLSTQAFSVHNANNGMTTIRRVSNYHHSHNNNNNNNNALKMNFLSDLGDALTGGKLTPQSSLPYSPPFCGTHSILDEVSSFAVRERALSFTGEDFDIYCPHRNTAIVRVRGAMLHLPGKDKMRIQSAVIDDDGGGGESYEEVAVLDRVLLAVTPTYDLYRGGMGAEKVGWIEKKVVALTETFDVYMEGKGGFGPFKPPPAYEICGDFLERSFVMKNGNGEVVAKASKDGIFQFDAFNHYQVQVAPGMDSLLVLACVCAIDEEMDEEHKEKKQKEQEREEGGGGWF